MIYNIQPVQIFPGQATKILISQGSINYYPFEPIEGEPTYAVFNYSLVDDAGKSLKNGGCGITKSQYEEWGTDDSYIGQCVAQNLGLTIL